MKIILFAILCLGHCSLFAQSTAFVYQGRLLDGGTPANSTNDFRFRIYSDEAGNNLAGSNAFAPDVVVSNGLFTALVDFGASAFDGSDRWIEVAVRPGANTGAYTSLTPLQRIGSTPYAIQSLKAGTVTGAIADSQLSANIARLNATQTFSGNVNFNNSSNTFLGNGAGLANVNAATLNGVSASNLWNTSGNSGTTAGANFIGTTDNQPLELKVNGERALRIEPHTNSAPNFIGGAHVNHVEPGVFGATIAGGGGNYFGSWVSNRISANFGFIGGGERNSISADAMASVIGGGIINNIGTDAETATIGGGVANNIRDSAYQSTISGGFKNDIGTNAIGGAIGGGVQNTNSGFYATVPGGKDNHAGADYSFAAGRRAKAIHNGTFAWADSQNANFASTGTNQFLVRASGGVGINTNNPQSALHVNGTITANNFSGIGATLSGPVTVNGNTVWHTGNDGAGSGLDADTVDGISASGLWRLGGNSGTTPGTDFIGTTDNNALELKVNGLRALRIEPTSLGRPNIVGGHVENYTQPGIYGAVIAGGGSGAGLSNSVSSSYGFIGAGFGNTIKGSSRSSVIGGGERHIIGPGADNVTIGGGYVNQSAAGYTTIAGGALNSIETNAMYATISGGSVNLIQTNGGYSFIGGGTANRIQTDSTYSVVAGGDANTISPASGAAFIGGGLQNILHTNTDGSVIVGGFNNEIGSDTLRGSIGGGQNNEIETNANYSTIAGGYFNTNTGPYASIAGGDRNVAGTNSFAAGHRAKATHKGSFVWADSTEADFATTATNQFLVRAKFVGINRNDAINSSTYFSVRAPVTNVFGGMYVETTGNGQPFYGYATSNSVRAYHYVDGNDGNKWKLHNDSATRMTVTTNGNVGIGNTSPTNLLMVSNARCDGSSWINASDRNLKQDFAPVDTRAVLEKVAALPVESWSYKAQPAEKHIGPVAQDFRAAFGLGADGTSIATVDEAGVALAAIKGLNEKVEEKEAKIQKLEAKLAELERMLTLMSSTTK